MGNLPNVVITNIDSLTYAANTELREVFSRNNRYREHNFSINSNGDIAEVLKEAKPDVIVNFAAESHVDNSIESPEIFFETNVLGTVSLMEAIRAYVQNSKSIPRFLHVSTDEVYGDLPLSENPSKEGDIYRPSSPYAASKAASDHVARSWSRTYSLPILITHCTNNYGPFQHREKFIPVVIDRLLNGQRIPVYGDGKQVRDWIFVEDHVRALWGLLCSDVSVSSVNISSKNEIQNIELCRLIHGILVENGEIESKFEESVEFVVDRKGHDRRYALIT